MATDDTKFSSTQIPLEGTIRERVLELGKGIATKDLAVKGLEDDPHITLKYGLHDNSPDSVRQLLSRIQRPIRFSLGKVSIFSGSEKGKGYDVVKVDVGGPDLHELNALLRTLPNTEDFPEYQPHVTIGYVKKGKGEEYAKRFGELNLKGQSSTVVFSAHDRNHTEIPVGKGTVVKFSSDKSPQPIIATLTGDRQRTREAFKNLFPGHGPEKVARAAGALDGSEVTFSAPTLDTMRVHVVHPQMETFRTFRKSVENGVPRLTVEHSAQVAERGLRGTGYKRFKDVLGHLQDLGVHAITVDSAAGHSGAADNGYYTWPRFGFQGKLDKYQSQGLPDDLKTALGGDFTFHKLFSVPGGPEYWKEHGSEANHLHFDLTPGSEHHKRFEDYHARREAAGRVRGSGAEVSRVPQSGSGDPTGDSATDQGTAEAAGVRRFARSLINALRKIKPAMKPLRYEAQPPVHNLVGGFRIGRVLQHLATSPEATSDVKLLAKQVLHGGDTTALKPLYDALQDQDHPLAHSYNWPNAEWKLHLDAAVGHALDAVHRVNTERGYDPAQARSLAHSYVQNANQGVNREFAQNRGRIDPEANAAAAEAIGILHGIGHSKEDIAESLNRHHLRTRDQGRPDGVDQRALAVKPERDVQEVAARYSRTPNPKRGDFLAALKRVQSSQQGQLRELAKGLYQKLGLDPTTVRDAIHSNLGTASAGTAAAIYHNSDPDVARLAAAQYGLASQSPSLLLFHVDPQGPDSVHKVSVRGSGEGALKQLDRFGLTKRTLIPTKTGYEVLIVDPDSQLGDKVKAFATAHGSTVTAAKGRGELLGGGDDSAADSDARSSYRSILRQYQNQQQPSPQSTTTQVQPNAGVQ